MFAPSQDTAQDKEDDHDNRDDHLAAELFGCLQHAVDGCANGIRALIDFYNTADDHDTEHHICGCCHAFRNRTEHLKNRYRRPVYRMVTVRKHPGHAIHGFTVVSTRFHKIRYDGT